jgi:hypothetical protein
VHIDDERRFRLLLTPGTDQEIGFVVCSIQFKKSEEKFNFKGIFLPFPTFLANFIGLCLHALCRNFVELQK